MNPLLLRAIERVRRPEYTGENRCVPCTIANLAIALVASALVGLVSPLMGGVVLIPSVAVIYLRGYLVPGTPELTQRYFPDWVLRRFERSTARTLPITNGPGEENGSDEPLDVEATLIRIGAVEECDDRDDLCLREPFREAWHERIDAAREHDAGRERLLAFLALDEREVTFEEHGEAFVARIDDGQIGRWESRGAFLADIGAAAMLVEHASVWNDLTVPERAQLLGGLRLFLDRCPACGGPLTFGERAVRSCCRSTDVVELACETCEARLFEVDAETLAG